MRLKQSWPLFGLQPHPADSPPLLSILQLNLQSPTAMSLPISCLLHKLEQPNLILFQKLSPKGLPESPTLSSCLSRLLL